ncbi:histone-like nucleoid-structuring protein Lsr2 [Nocardioides deserti]|uniref:Lsr2 family protein n=1 Tax=Nocardioides deserti TaxID=1588644 RepID=A0ABR6UAN0_9ACTN|nr:Lsr2 family protein [Nocardioides deserti]MBC2961502.1 Lsr2 family protein [Nocardioides deserti]GGO78333.1 Lsr2 family protein [Nocardioides deserti]
MAQKIHIVLEDDLDGSEATETVSFGLDGTSYEIDLNDQNAAALRESLATYVGHARKVSGARRGGGRRSGGSSSSSANGSGGPTAKEVREWARENGYEVPDRGRVSAEVREAYDAAH